MSDIHNIYLHKLKFDFGHVDKHADANVTQYNKRYILSTVLQANVTAQSKMNMISVTPGLMSTNGSHSIG